MPISDQQKKRLTFFCTKAKALSSTKLFAENNLSIGLNVSYTAGGPTVCRPSGPSKPELLEIVTTVRQFYADKEQINFKSIYNIAYPLLKSRNEIRQEVIKSAESVRETFDQILQENPLGMRFRGQTLNSQRIIDIWFNGNIFHADIEKTELYDNLWKSPGGPIAEFMFRGAIINLACLMIYFGQLTQVEILNKDPNSFN